MALPPTTVARRPLHRRAIRIEAFQRDDGLFDLDAWLTDVKPHPVQLSAGARRDAHQPIHDMGLRVTVDAQLTIVDVSAGTDAVPVPGACEAIGPAYRALVGLNLLRSFRAEIRARLGRTQGCTHLSELAAQLPTAALQALAHLLRDRRFDDPSVMPFYIGQCHAYDRSGATVRQHFPRWFVPAE